MNYFPLIPAFAAFINFGLALFVFTRNVRLRLNQVFFVMGLALTVWNIGAALLFGATTSAASAVYLVRFMHMGVIFIPVAVLHLSALITHRSLGKALYAAYGTTFALAILNFTDWFIDGATKIGFMWVASPGPCYAIFLGLFASCTTPALLLIWYARLEAKAKGKKRFNALLLADCLLLFWGSHDLLPIFGITTYPFTHIPVYPWGLFAAGLYGLLVGHSLLHAQLLDIRVSIGRQAATLLRFFFLASVCYVAFVVGNLFLPGAFTLTWLAVGLFSILVGAAVAGIFFPRIMGGDSESIERRILGDRFEYHSQMRDFISRIIDYTDYDPLIIDTLQHIRQLMGLSSARIILLTPKTKEIRASVGFPVITQTQEQHSRLASVLDYFRNGTSELDFRNPQSSVLPNAEETHARQCLRPLDPEYAFAIKRPDALFGTVILGHKRDAVPFTQDDVELGQALASALAVTMDRIQLKDRATYLEKMELLSVMSSGLAHDLNNGLTPILTYLQMRGEEQRVAGSMDLFEKEDFSIALKNAQILRANIESTLFFSRQQKPNFQKVSALSLLERAFDLQIRPDRQKCKLMVRDDAQSDIECDAVMLGRIMDNLVGNAIDASENGGSIWIVASVLPATPLRKKWIRFRVTDQGSGIPPEILKKVFEPYFSTKKTGDTKRGFGLGLSIVERLIYLHGGIVTIESTVGKGTTVQFDIPAIQPDSSEHPFAASQH